MGRKRWFRETEKRCSICKQWLPNSKFNKNKSAISGLNFECRECGNKRAREYAKEYWKRNPHILLWKSAQQRAHKFHLPFNITPEDIHIPMICPVLGIPLKYGNKKAGKGDSPSLDRIVPELGYIKNNIAVISFRANTIKSNASVAEIRKVASYYERMLYEINH